MATDGARGAGVFSQATGRAPGEEAGTDTPRKKTNYTSSNYTPR